MWAHKTANNLQPLCMFRRASGVSHSTVLTLWPSICTARTGLCSYCTLGKCDSSPWQRDSCSMQQQQPEHAHTDSNSSIIVVTRWPADEREQIQMTQQVAARNCSVGRCYWTIQPRSVLPASKNLTNSANGAPHSGKCLISVSHITLQCLRISLCLMHPTF